MEKNFIQCLLNWIPNPLMSDYHDWCQNLLRKQLSAMISAVHPVPLCLLPPLSQFSPESVDVSCQCQWLFHQSVFTHSSWLEQLCEKHFQVAVTSRKVNCETSMKFMQIAFFVSKLIRINLIKPQDIYKWLPNFISLWLKYK